MIGDLPRGDPAPALASVDPTWITMGHDRLELVRAGYSGATPLCCPELAATDVHRWDGLRFTLTSHTVVAGTP